MNTAIETAKGSDTTILQKTGSNGNDSTFFGVSVRAWLAFILVVTIAITYIIVVAGVVVDAILNKDWSKVGTFANVGEPLYSMSIAALSFYFGQKTSRPA
jgi:hypothetical protein